ncbi:MAG: DUF1254 domain-containing protein [Archaeoglobaceae archaeon]
MSNRAKGLAVIVFFAVLSHLALVYAFPYAIVISSYLATKDEVKVNEVYHQKPVDASFRKVVMPSPDILYSACVYDISKSDLLIEARVPKFTYWSASFYSLSTDNFFTVNDRMVGDKVTLILTTNKSCMSGKCVVSPSERGIVIFRIFIPDKSLLPVLEEFRRSIECREIPRS